MPRTNRLQEKGGCQPDGLAENDLASSPLPASPLIFLDVLQVDLPSHHSKLPLTFPHTEM
jgi:hypothetical protein